MSGTADRGTGATATVFIPVFNGGQLLAEVVDMVLRQRAPIELEVLAIDSGSTDGSLEILASRAVRTVQIPNKEFGHGRTRNLAVDLSASEFVAFLTQDATPRTEGWLAALLEAFEDPSVGASWGPQIPRATADARTARIISEVYDSTPRVVRDHDENYPVFSDVNSCLRRAAWARVPFRDVAYAEDFYLSRDLLEAKIAISYVPSAGVTHSNSYGIRQHFGRMLDEIGGLPRWEAPVRLPWVVRDWSRQVLLDAQFSWRRSRRRSARDIAWASVAEAQRSLAVYLHNRHPATFERLLASRSLERQLRPESETPSRK